VHNTGYDWENVEAIIGFGAGYLVQAVAQDICRLVVRDCAGASTETQFCQNETQKIVHDFISAVTCVAIVPKFRAATAKNGANRADSDSTLSRADSDRILKGETSAALAARVNLSLHRHSSQASWNRLSSGLWTSARVVITSCHLLATRPFTGASCASAVSASDSNSLGSDSHDLAASRTTLMSFPVWTIGVSRSIAADTQSHTSDSLEGRS